METVADRVGSKELAKKYVDALKPEKEDERLKKETGNVKEEKPKESEPRHIDVESLRDYFTLTFCGKNFRDVDYFAEYLLPNFAKKVAAKYYAKLALAMYESPNMRVAMRPSTFSAFYADVAKKTGIPYNQNYQPNKIRLTPDEQKKLWYLVEKVR